MMTTSTANRRLRPLLDRQLTAWTILGFFADTPKNEACFARLFSELSPEDRTFLGAFYNMGDPRDVLRRICVFWNVPLKHNPVEN